MNNLFARKNRQASFRSWMIWSIANKEIIELLTITDLVQIQGLSFKILELTKVSWLDVMKAISDVERECNKLFH